MRIALLILAACGRTAASQPAPDLCGMNGGIGPSGICLHDGQLRVLSYNVNFGLAGDPAGVAAVAAANADIVVLQETNAAWERAFTDALGARFPHRRFQSPHGMPAGGMGVLSRDPIVSIDELPSHGGFFFAWKIVVQSRLGPLQILDVHLRPPISDSGSWVSGFFTTRGDRETELEYHLAALDPKLPTIIAGDFNEDADGLATARLRDLGYADAIDQHAGRARTWEWPVGSITLRMQLDHIFHDDHFVAVDARIVEAGRSDHKPVWADFARIDP